MNSAGGVDDGGKVGGRLKGKSYVRLGGGGTTVGRWGVG